MATSLVRGKYVICKVTGRREAQVIEDGAGFQRDGVIRCGCGAPPPHAPHDRRRHASVLKLASTLRRRDVVLLKA